jgi:hypothetical protein
LNEKMKKVLFLMFLLFLIVLGTAGVKAQVRIGGNAAPSQAAVLDLNAGNDNAANTATGGLVLPRVNLTSNTMQLTNGVANQTGTMVYDVTATLGRIGVYYWNGNNWVLASLPSTSAADSGRFLMSTGNGVIWRPVGVTTNAGSSSMGALLSTSWQKYQVYLPLPMTVPFTWYSFTVPGTLGTDICFRSNGGNFTLIEAYVGSISVYTTVAAPSITMTLECFRPS